MDGETVGDLNGETVGDKDVDVGDITEEKYEDKDTSVEETAGDKYGDKDTRVEETAGDKYEDKDTSVEETAGDKYGDKDAVIEEDISDLKEQSQKLWDLCSGKDDVSLEHRINQLQDLLHRHPKVINMTDINNQSALHHAVLNNQPEILSVLLHKGANPELQNAVLNFTPLMSAIAMQSYYCVATLLDFKVNVNASSLDGRTALHVAVEQHNADGRTIKRLLELNADVDRKYKKNLQTPIHIAAKIGSDKILKILLDMQPKTLNAFDSSKLTPLHLAASFGHRDCCKLLMKSGADCSAKNKQGETPLMLAAKNCYLQTCDVLLKDNSIAINIVNKMGQSPLELVVKSKKKLAYDLLKKLLECNPNLQEKDTKGNTPLHFAAKGGFAEKCTLLIKAGADCNVMNKSKMTPLHCAAKEKYPACIAALIDIPYQEDCDNSSISNKDDFRKGPVDVNIKDDLEKGPVDDNIKDDLRESPVDVNIKDELGKAPIHYALEKGSLECCVVLLRGRANVCLKDNKSNTPLHYAARQDLSGCCSRILSKGASVHSKNKEGQTPLHFAAEVGSRACCQVLVKKGAKINEMDKYSKTPLHYASESGSIECTDFLLKKIDKPFDNFHMYATPLHLAVKKGDIECCKRLIQNPVMTKCLITYDENNKMPHNIAFEEQMDDIFGILIHGALNFLDDFEKKDTHKSKGKVSHIRKIKDDDSKIFKPSLDNLLQQCIHEKRSSAVEAIVKSMKWKDALISREKRSFDTNFLLLVEHYPECAKVILDKCKETTHDGIFYSFLYLEDTYSYEVQDIDDSITEKSILDQITDFALDVTDSVCSEIPHADRIQQFLDWIIIHLREILQIFLVNVVYPSDYLKNGIQQDQSLVNNQIGTLPQWSPFKASGELKNGVYKKSQCEATWKENHPLQSMVKNERLDLLGHEVCQRFLNYKWECYIEKLFCTLFIILAVFAVLLSIYVTLAYDWVYVHRVHNVTRTSICEDQKDFCSNEQDMCNGMPVFLQGTAFQEFFRVLSLFWLILVVGVELFKIHNYYGTYDQIKQLMLVFLNYIWSLILLLNWTECASITGIREEHQWTCGVISVMVAWFDLILLLGSMPCFGLYLVIFNDFMKTMMKLATFSFLQVFAFSVAFQMLLRDRFAFSNFPRTIMKIMSMTMGDLDYDELFSNEENPLHYPLLSHLLLICFLVLISAIMLNFVSKFSQKELDKAKTQTNLLTLSRSVDITLRMESMFPALRKRYARCWILDSHNAQQKLYLNTFRTSFVKSEFTDDSTSEDTSDTCNCKCEDVMTKLDDLKLQIGDLENMLSCLNNYIGEKSKGKYTYNK